MTNQRTKNASKENEAGERLRRGLLLSKFENSGMDLITFAHREFTYVSEMQSKLMLARQERDETTGAIG